MARSSASDWIFDIMYTYTATVAKIVDGDSVWLVVDVGYRMTYKDNFRLIRINTPELRSRDAEVKAAAYAAKDRLRELIPVGAEVLIRTAKSGKYGRWLAEIYVDDGYGELVNINDIMVEEGHAVPFMV